MAEYKVPGEHIYKGMVMPVIFPADVLDKVPHFEFRPDDILINTYPKAGTTWIQQITWLIMNNIDIETAKKVPMGRRSPFIEFKIPGNEHGVIDDLVDMESPRIIKSHLPYSFFKESIEKSGEHGFKTVVGMRNAKDVLVSYYHFYRMNSFLVGRPDMTFEEFFDLFKTKRIVHGDYFDHVVSWWKERENPRLYFVKYEDLKDDPKGEITKLASFLGKELSESEIDDIVRESSFNSMQKDSTVNMASNPRLHSNVSKFIRKGEVGDWQNHFTEEQRQYVDNLSETLLAANGLTFRDT